MSTKVAVQGIEGSFHHQAAENLLGNEIELVNCKTFQEVFGVVQNGQANYGVVAIENNLYGSINSVYRLLARNLVWVCGEVSLQIEQFLIGPPNSSDDLKKIQRVLSQAPALAQCELWLEANTPQAHLERMHDTAESVRYIVNHPDQPFAAIASKRAAKQYGGKILAGPINDEKHNYTRFFLLTKDKTVPHGADKTSIILETGHEPGALYRALGAFAEADLNLTKLDSHPIASDKQHYAFYTDFEAALNKDFNHPVLDTLRAQGCKVTVLGSYKSQKPLIAV